MVNPSITVRVMRGEEGSFLSDVLERRATIKVICARSGSIRAINGVKAVKSKTAWLVMSGGERITRIDNYPVHLGQVVKFKLVDVDEDHQG